MAPLLVAAGFLALAALAPWLGRDSTDARTEGAQGHRTAWPAYPASESDVGSR